MTVFKKANKSHLERTMFFDEPDDVQRYDRVKYSQFEKQNDKMLSLFWRPEEVNPEKDKIDFDKLTDHERHIFTSNHKPNTPNTCLLYTSPSPRDRQKSRMPSSA